MRSRDCLPDARLRTLLLLLALAPAQGCVAVSAEIEQVRHSVQTQQLSFAGAGPLAGQAANETRVFDATLDSQLMDYLVHARLTELRVVPASGVSNLDFVREVRIRLLSAGGAFWYWLDRTTEGIVVALFTGGMGVGIELALIHLSKTYGYTHGDLFGVPSWLPGLYFIAAGSIGNFGRFLKQPTGQIPKE